MGRELRTPKNRCHGSVGAMPDPVSILFSFYFLLFCSAVDVLTGEVCAVGRRMQQRTRLSFAKCSWVEQLNSNTARLCMHVCSGIIVVLDYGYYSRDADMQ